MDKKGVHMERVYFGDSLAVGASAQDPGTRNLAVVSSGILNRVTINGRRTSYDELVPQINRGDQVVISLGTNDLGYISTDTQFNRYTARVRELVDQIRAEGASEIVFLTLNSIEGRPELNAYMDELNAFYRQLDRESSIIRTANTESAADNRAGDHIHYTRAGYRAMVAAVNAPRTQLSEAAVGISMPGHDIPNLDDVARTFAGALKNLSQTVDVNMPPIALNKQSDRGLV
jgi:lysophospholipase L1-like esterase